MSKDVVALSVIGLLAILVTAGMAITSKAVTESVGKSEDIKEPDIDPDELGVGA